MILLDTNIVSEVMRPGPDPRVLRWLDDQDSDYLFLSSITVAEIAFGIRILADGKRGSSLEERFDHFISTGFEFRILPFDTAAAYLFAELMGRRRELGRPLSFPDGQIAAIALSGRLSLATRNVSDFDHCGLDIINPFQG